jgi:hypothetical protein
MKKRSRGRDRRVMLQSAFLNSLEQERPYSIATIPRMFTYQREILLLWLHKGITYHVSLTGKHDPGIGLQMEAWRLPASEEITEAIPAILHRILAKREEAHDGFCIGMGWRSHRPVLGKGERHRRVSLPCVRVEGLLSNGVALIREGDILFNSFPT